MLNICVVGCGRIARQHLKALEKLESKIHLAATVDLDETRAAEYAGEFNADRHFSDPGEAAACGEVDASIICLPHSALTAVSRIFLEHGKHVLVEKPMGVDVEALRDVIRLSTDNSLVFQPGYVCRFMPSFVEMKKRLDAGDLGEVRHILCASHGYIDKPATPWWASAEKAGGFYLPIFASHAIDRMIWIAGARPDRIYADLQSALPGIEGESDGLVSLSFPGDIHASVSFSATSRGKGLKMEYISTTLSTLELSYSSLIIDGKSVPLPAVNPFEAQLEEFHAAIKEGRRSMPDAADGLSVLEVINEMQKSSHEQRMIEHKE